MANNLESEKRNIVSNRAKKTHTHTIAYTAKTAKFRSKNKQVPNRFLSFFSQACMNRHGMAYTRTKYYNLFTKMQNIAATVFVVVSVEMKKKKKEKNTLALSKICTEEMRSEIVEL